jgi:protoheme ferro-lyase
VITNICFMSESFVQDHIERLFDLVFIFTVLHSMPRVSAL